MMEGNRIFRFGRGGFLYDLETDIYTIPGNDEIVSVNIQPGVVFRRAFQMSDRRFDMPAAELKQIVSFLDTIRDWKTRYECAEDVLDGYGWDTTYHHGGVDYESGGYMAYPSDFWKKVSELQMIIEDLWRKYDPYGYSPAARQKRIEL